MDEEVAAEGRVAELEAEKVGAGEVGDGDVPGSAEDAFRRHSDRSGPELLDDGLDVVHEGLPVLHAVEGPAVVLELVLKAPKALVECNVYRVALQLGELAECCVYRVAKRRRRGHARINRAIPARAGGPRVYGREISLFETAENDAGGLP